MRYILLLVFTILLASCSTSVDPEQHETQEASERPIETEPNQSLDPTEIPTQKPIVEPTQAVELPNLGPAPELTNEIWLNTDQPLRLTELEGNVVLLEMWTFG
jgi:hypothetical protein